MCNISLKGDFYSFNLTFPLQFTIAVTKTIMVIELIGIKIAANKGVSVAVTAKDKPTALYKKEIKKLNLMMVMLSLDNRNREGSEKRFLASKMASLEGVNEFTSSVIVIPKSEAAKAPASFNPSPIIQTFFPSLCNF